MSEATSYSKLGYLMLKKESTAGTAVYPDTPIEILSESIVVNWDFTSVAQIAGKRSMDIRPALNQVGPFEGTIEFYVEPRQHGNFLNAVFGEDSVTTLSASESYQHDYEPQNTLVSYTMDIKMAGENYVTRYFGVRAKKITYTKDENKIKAAFDITAQRVFQNARVTTAVSSGTSLDLDQTSGLTTSDTILVLDATAPSTTLATLTITSVDSETDLTVSTISASLDADDIVVIQARTLDTEDYEQSNELIFAGGADVYISNGANAIQALSAKTNVEDFEISIENEIEARWAATGTDVVDRMPSAMLLKGVRVTGKFNQFHTTPEFLDMLRENEQVGLRFNFFGNTLDSNSAASATGTIESDGAGTVTVTVDSAGEAGNDYAIIVEQGTSAGAATASLSGKLITLTLSTTASNNAVATIATTIDALSGVSATSSSTGNVTTTDNPDKIEFGNGRDANERELLRFDFPNVRLNVFNANLSADDIINEEIPFTAYWDENDEREIKVRLRTIESDY
jgi:hypothetical protein